MARLLSLVTPTTCQQCYDTGKVRTFHEWGWTVDPCRCEAGRKYRATDFEDPDYLAAIAVVGCLAAAVLIALGAVLWHWLA